MTTEELDKLISTAFDAANDATMRYLQQNPDSWFPCGFAWVIIKPARGPLVKRLKEMKIGEVDKYQGGYKVWNPSNVPTQSMIAKKVGADAFVKVLRAAGYSCKAHETMD